jgi:hypothetical protein
MAFSPGATARTSGASIATPWPPIPGARRRSGRIRHRSDRFSDLPFFRGGLFASPIARQRRRALGANADRFKFHRLIGLSVFIAEPI